MKCAFIIQRYGRDLSGGAEEHARRLAEHLAPDHEIEILTTCAGTYDTWENIFKPGVETINGVTVRRFPTDFCKEKDSFDLLTGSLTTRPHTLLDELEWLVHQGPYSESLFHYLRRNHQDYDWCIFYTYLYITSVFGLMIAPEKSILISTAHDEPVIQFMLYRMVFNLPRGLIYLTEEEQAFVEKTFHNSYKPSALIGMGMDQWQETPAEPFLQKYNITTPYILYIGRVDSGKGCRVLIDYFLRYIEESGNRRITLVLVGARHMEEVKHPRIVMPGYVSEAEKQAALSGARAIVSPSQFESLSILLLEGFNAGKPLLANGGSEVVKGHCRKSNAGLVYETYEEFREHLGRLLSDDRLCQTLGEHGRRYIDGFYRWPRVIERFTTLLESMKQ